jgi:hypothetical protein
VPQRGIPYVQIGLSIVLYSKSVFKRSLRIFANDPVHTFEWLKNNGIQSNKSATFTIVLTSNLMSMKFYFYYPTNTII